MRSCHSATLLSFCDTLDIHPDEIKKVQGVSDGDFSFKIIFSSFLAKLWTLDWLQLSRPVLPPSLSKSTLSTTRATDEILEWDGSKYLGHVVDDLLRTS